MGKWPGCGVCPAVYFPPQKAEYADNCYTVSGRWPFGSGCMSAELIGVGIVSPDALPCMAVMPRSAVQIQENWDVIGMVGTGSHDIVVDSVKVPEEWTFIRGSSPNIDAPFFPLSQFIFCHAGASGNHPWAGTRGPTGGTTNRKRAKIGYRSSKFGRAGIRTN